MDDSPFTPYDRPLKEVLRQKYIKPVAEWLLSNDEHKVLAQSSSSNWESALTVIFLSSVSDIFEMLNEEPELRERIKSKSANVARWLIEKTTNDLRGTRTYPCWEKVTWDTAVIIKSLLIALKKYDSEFAPQQKEKILHIAAQGICWLHCRFNEWENEVKYPFGPADIAQIALTMIYIRKEYPNLYEESTRMCYGQLQDKDLAAEIIEYLIHIKTEKSITIHTSIGETEDIVTYWWDDYFTTAEVIEALAAFHLSCEEVPALKTQFNELLEKIKEAIVGACFYFEQNQVDGTWGSHIDTIKVIHSYVLIQNIVPEKQRRRLQEAAKDNWWITPEIHTTFKALRWICDDKQIFSDGSFLHTMFLTVFYSLALVEVHNSWKPAEDQIGKLYDDVVWASPVRTTPERNRRLKESLQNHKLQERLRELQESLEKDLEDSKHRNSLLKKSLITIATVVVVLVLFLFLGQITQRHQFNITYSLEKEKGDLFEFSGFILSLTAFAFAMIWVWSDRLKVKLYRLVRKSKQEEPIL